MDRHARRLIVFSSLAIMWGANAAAATGEARVAEAVKNRDRESVRTLLNQHVDVNIPEPDGATALHWAVHLDDVDTVDLLIRAGARVDAVNDFAVTPLSLACTNRNAGIVERLLTAGANPNAALASGETPLMTCTRTGSVDGVKSLLAHRADIGATEPSQKQSALMWAVAEHHPDVVRMLIEHGADVHAQSASGFTPLHFAAREGDVDAAGILCDAGAKVNATASDGSTPLVVATVRGNVPVALYLLEHGADPNAAAAGFAALHWASGTWETHLTGLNGFVDPMGGIVDRAAKLALVKALLAHGANPNARAVKSPPRFGYTTHTRTKDFLSGATPFTLAAFAADVEVMRVLVAAGADPKLATENNTTPLMLAAGIKRAQGESPVTEDTALDAVKFTLELGGNVNALNDEGENCLHGVAYLGWNKLLRFLLEQGTQVNVVSKRRLTPLLIARGDGDRDISATVIYHKDTAELLLAAGADPTLGVPCKSQGCGMQ